MSTLDGASGPHLILLGKAPLQSLLDLIRAFCEVKHLIAAIAMVIMQI